MFNFQVKKHELSGATTYLAQLTLLYAVQVSANHTIREGHHLGLNVRFAHLETGLSISLWNSLPGL